MLLILVSLCGVISCVSQHKHLLVHLNYHSITKIKQGPFRRPQTSPSKLSLEPRPSSEGKAAVVTKTGIPVITRRCRAQHGCHVWHRHMCRCCRAACVVVAVAAAETSDVAHHGGGCHDRVRHRRCYHRSSIGFLQVRQQGRPWARAGYATILSLQI